jgi:hypothetical protein
MLLFGGYEFPQPMMVSLGQITAADPSFDSAGFLSFAQGAYWKIHGASASGDLGPIRNLVNEPMWQQLHAAKAEPLWATPIQSLEQAAIVSVARDASYDTVTVRVGARSAAKKKNELVEDWTFQRPAASWGGATSAPPATECPSCGAPLSTDENGTCHYCHVPIKGVAGDWRLIATSIPTVKKDTSGNGCGWSGFVIFLVLVTVVVPLAITGIVLYEVNKTTDQAFNSFGGNPLVSTTKVPNQGSLDGTLTLNGGINGTMTPDVLATPDGDSGSCASRATKVKSVTFNADLTDTTNGVRQKFIVTVALPEGSVGAGTYQGNNVNVVLHQTPLSGSSKGAAEDNTWSTGAGATSTVTVAGNDSGTVTFDDLVPTDPQWKALSGTMTFTCS